MSASTSSSAKNPISLRMYKILGAKYDDGTTRDALLSLSEFYTPKQPASSSTGNSRDEIPLKHGELATRARKNLRRDLESRLANGSDKFLKAFKIVDQHLVALDECIADMKLQCSDLEMQLQSTSNACSTLLARAEGLSTERRAAERRRTTVNLFIQRFTLSDVESSALTSRESVIDSQFFEALAKTERIREECNLLLTGEEDGNRVGMDIMAQSSSQLEQGYEQLARRTRNEFRSLNFESHVDPNLLLRKSVQSLRARPVLLVDALSILAETRQNTLLQSFLTALTRGGPGGLPRPIEMHAHDPVRYVGDMIGWIHQALAGECDFLDLLFNRKDPNRMVGSVRTFDTSEPSLGDETAWIAGLIDAAFEGLCRPLKHRVLQTLRSQEAGVTAYKLDNLLIFYAITIGNTIGHDAVLSKNLKELTVAASDAFYHNMEAKGRSFLRFLHPPEADLAPPLALLDASQVLKELMSVHDSSLTSGESEDNRRTEQFDKSVAAYMDPLIDMCSKMTKLNPSTEIAKVSWERDIFLVNCLSYLQIVLQPFAFMINRVQELEEQIRAHLGSLVEQHSERVLRESGLAPVLETIEQKPENTILSQTDGASSQTLNQTLSRFSNYLSHLDVLRSEDLAKLSVPTLIAEIHREALWRLAHAYDRICVELRNPENKYEFSSTMLGSHRPFGQMSTLWQILGIQGEDA